MMHLRKLILILFLCVFTSLSFGAGVEVDLILTSPNAQIFFVGDLDPTGMGNAPEFFQLHLRNLPPSEDKEIILIFEVMVGGVVIVDAKSDPFVLPVGENLIFTNTNLNTGSAVIPSTGEEIELNNYNVDYDRAENLKDQILATGRLPNNEYQFLISWQEYNNNIPVGNPVPDPNLNDNILTISNPTRIEPVYPGSRVSEDNIQEVMTTFPYILYQSDASEFNIKVFEKYASDESIQDVLSHDPVLDVRGYPNLLFQYPTDPSPLIFDSDPLGDGFGGSVGPVRPIEHGKIYYYFVEAVIQSSSGTEIIPSDVYQFKVSSIEAEASASNVVTIYLQQILSGQFADILTQLEGYTYTGNIYLNGTPIQLDDLSQIINQALQNKIEIKNVYIE